MNNPIVEPLGDGLERVWRVDEVLFDGKTSYQHVVIARTAHGVSLFCDNDRQSTELSQLVYHEALIVPGLLLADQLHDVLIVGSSEGVASQIAATAGANVDHVDIDQEAVELCAQHLPYGYSPEELKSAVAGEGPIRVRYDDGYQYVLDTDKRYDLVLIDLPDEHEGEAQHNRLYGEEFLTACAAKLRPGGVVVNQAGCPTLWRNETLRRSWERFTNVFPTVNYFGSDEQEWAFLTGRPDQLDDHVDVMVQRLASLPYRPQHIDAAALRASSVPPLTIRA